MGSNGELLENLYCTKIEGHLASHSKTSHSSKKSLNFFDYTYSTNNCDFLNLHAQSEYKKSYLTIMTVIIQLLEQVISKNISKLDTLLKSLSSVMTVTM